MSRTDPRDRATDWRRVHEELVEQFRAGWASPDPHAWDEFIDPQMEFVQPMLRHGSGAAHWWEESGRTLVLLPDLRAEVLSWAGDRETLFIAIRFDATLAGKPLTWDAVDVLRLTPEGKAVARHSFFDSAPVAGQVLRRPRAWLRWWRSGVGPLLWRRRIPRSVLARMLAALHSRSHAPSVGRLEACRVHRRQRSRTSGGQAEQHHSASGRRRRFLARMTSFRSATGPR